MPRTCFQREQWSDAELEILKRSIDNEGKTFREVESILGNKTYMQIVATWAFFSTPGQLYWSLARNKMLIEVSKTYTGTAGIAWKRARSDGVLRREFPGVNDKTLASQVTSLKGGLVSMDPFVNRRVTVDEAFNPGYVPGIGPLHVRLALGATVGSSASAPSASASSASAPSTSTTTLGQGCQSEVRDNFYDHNDPFIGYFDDPVMVDESDEDDEEGGQSSSKR